MINELLEKYSIDGIECMHSEFNNEEIDYMLNLCKEKNYFMSGGSVYNGKNKPNIEMATGIGNLKIESSMIRNWIDEKKLI